MTTGAQNVCITIGGLPIRFACRRPAYLDMLCSHYDQFLGDGQNAEFGFDVEIAPAVECDDVLRVNCKGSHWRLERGDVRASWDLATGRGIISQSMNPYSVDAVLRIVHSLALAGQGGFLLHAASVIRNRRAFLFAGVSVAGKTTLARLAPADVTVLTDEISYVRCEAEGYRAYGTPFAGELARSGPNVSAPIEAAFLLEKGRENRIRPLNKAEAVRALLRNILFFAEDASLVKALFDSAVAFVSRIPVRRLSFLPDERVWDLIDGNEVA